MYRAIRSQEWTHRFFTAIPEMIVGRKKWEIDLAEVWDSVAFYNFIQECLDGPKAAVNEQMLQIWKVGFSAYPRKFATRLLARSQRQSLGLVD